MTCMYRGNAQNKLLSKIRKKLLVKVWRKILQYAVSMNNVVN